MKLHVPLILITSLPFQRNHVHDIRHSIIAQLDTHTHTHTHTHIHTLT
jgi:hypothetical protein